MELIPLKSSQPTVTFIPIVASELPFFSLTNNKNDLDDEIDFRIYDDAGDQKGRWQVFPNTSKNSKTKKIKIGRPGVEAHRVWYLLIKPAIDAAKKVNGKIPALIPLGGVRECLRAVGFSEGGHQSKELLKALRQISFAGVVADLPMPIGFNEDGKLMFKHLKGNYSRMSVYSIGDHHLTEEEFAQGNFDFNLEDKIYITLDPLEIMMQEGEADNQKLIDNEYMFSVNAAGRRWYELLANKVYGVVKNGGSYFEINYNWYIDRHHTLKRYDQRFRIVHQMNRVVRDHLAIDYLSKVEYRQTRDKSGKTDYKIRYYVGEEAKNSINRIQGYLLNERRKRPELTSAPLSLEREIKAPTPEEKSDSEALKPSATQLPITPEVELISYFIEKFFDGKTPPIKQGGKQQDQAKQLIQKHGEDKARFIVEFASAEAKKTNFDVQLFGAVLRYEAGAVSRFQEHQVNLKRKEEQRKKEAHQQEQDRIWRERQDFARKLFDELPEAELAELTERFTKEVESQESWSNSKLDSPTQRSIFNTLVNDEIRDYLLQKHDQENSKTQAN